ncbi:hypothetical protein EV424DRAFT_1469923 [Suillus variegatus]|nr:hypothetical protein EV424DRAFT_1469923 [Suillus variegatus]
MKEWISPVYAFFEPTPRIVEINGRRAHEFKCGARGCKTTIRQFLDKKDAKHVKSCWGNAALMAADDAKDANEVRTKIVTESFERKGKGKVTYSHRQHTRTEAKAEIVRWVSESLGPFKIIKDKGFQSLMKTGRPEYHIPSPTTVAHDVKLVFARTRQRIARMLQEYDGKMNFTTDGWTSMNHRALVAFSVHLEHQGVPLSFPLDIVEVATVQK